MADDRPRSWEVTEGSQRAPARAMLRAVGFSEEDFGKSQIAVASSWNEVTPCNYHLDKLAALAKEGVRQGGAVPIEFTTIAVSDGIAMGHEGMKASLISREVIADSVELVMHAERFDGLVGIAGCDKSEPAMLMAMARLNLASVYLYGGTILAGTYQDRDITIQDVFEAVGAHNNGTIDDDELLQIERAACPTTGSCAGMYTANTMAAAAEALGMSLPGAASPPAVDYRREVFARESGRQAAWLLANDGPRPRDIITKEAFENAIAVVMALAGSTNAVLHLLAIAREARVPLELDDFDAISRRVPHLVDVRPAGRFVMQDLDRVGGVPVVMKELLDAGLLHGDAITVTGKTIAENLEELAPSAPDGDVVRPVAEPIHPTGGTAILRGSIAPDGSVMKIAGAEGMVFTGTARPFDSEHDAFAALTAGTIVAGDVIVIRYEGPEGLARHARDARRHGGRRRRRPGQGCRADHRRTLQRRHQGVLRRPHRPRGVRRRPDRPHRGRRPDRDRRRRADGSTSRSTRPPWRRAAPRGRRPSLATRPARSPSTRSWSGPPITGP